MSDLRAGTVQKATQVLVSPSCIPSGSRTRLPVAASELHGFSDFGLFSTSLTWCESENHRLGEAPNVTLNAYTMKTMIDAIQIVPAARKLPCPQLVLAHPRDLEWESGFGTVESRSSGWMSGQMTRTSYCLSASVPNNIQEDQPPL